MVTYSALNIRMRNKVNYRIKDVAVMGMMVAVIEVSKQALVFLPNVELVSFWIVMFTLCFGIRKMFLVVPVFILIEGGLYGFGLWWIMYLYAWPLLSLLTWLCRRQQSVWFWSIVSGFFGLFFGLLCSIPYMIIGTVSGGVRNGLYTGFSWWVAGIPWDIVHGICNFIIMLVLYIPVRNVMRTMVQPED